MTQQTFWSKHHQWFAERPFQLSSQEVKEICRCSTIGNNHIVLGTECKIALHTCTAMFGTLSFITMWQQHHYTVHSFPFIFSTAQVLINDNLCAITEIAKLRFPHYQ